MKEHFKRIPILPLSATVLYLILLVLVNNGIMPHASEILPILEGWYAQFGILALVISTLLEGLVYVGLYFSGSFLIVLAVIFSEGSFPALLTISVVVALSLTAVSAVNYAIGRSIKSKKRGRHKKGLIFSVLHPNALAFYFFDAGIHRKGLKELIYVPILLIPYGLLLSYLIVNLKDVFTANVDNAGVMLSVLIIWLLVAWGLKYKEK